MTTSRRLYLTLAIGAAVWMGVACGSDVEVVADPSPVTGEPTLAPAAPVEAVPEDIDDLADQDMAAETTPAAVPVRSRGQQSASGQQGQVGAAYESIRDVDFMNGFTFVSDLDFGAPEVTVEAGEYSNGEFGDPDYFWFGVNQVDFGDLDGDGREEAIVSTSWNGGGSGYFDSVRAFRLVDGVVQTAGRVPFGDRADGGIFDLRIEDGATSVWAFSTTLGACCPNQVSRNRLVLGEHWLVWADRDPTRTWLSLGANGDDDELKFLPGTSSAMVAIYGYETSGAFVFEAARGQRLTLALTDGPAPADISVISVATGQVMSGLAEMELPDDGFYRVEVTFDTERSSKTILDVIIDDGEPEPPVSWTPTVEQVVVTSEPFVTSSLVWPVFVSDQPGATAANDALAAFVTELDDYWIQDVTEFSDPQDDSSYDLSYDVTLAAADLVSVRFNFYDYVCCRPYPNYGTRSAVLDLASGEILPISEIVDTNRLDEVTQLWLRELEKQDLLPDAAGLLGESPMFDSVTLVPGGVEFGTDRNSLGGGTPGTATVVTFEQLGDLVNPMLIARTAAA